MADRMQRLQHEGPGPGGDGPVGPGPSSPIFNAPAAVSWMAVFTIACHVVFLFLPPAAQIRVAWYGAVSPHKLLSGEGGVVVALAPLVGHMLLHGGWLHLFFNMIWLMAFGAPVARRLDAERPVGAGSASFVFIGFYLACGVAGALSYVALHPDAKTLLIGASGGVSGLLGGLVRFAFRPAYASPAEFSRLTDRPVLAWSGAIIALNGLAAVFGSGLFGGDGSAIAWESHIGGYLFGLLAFPVFARFARGG